MERVRRVDPLTAGLGVVGLAALVGTAVLVAQPATPQSWTAPAPPAVTVQVESDPGSIDVGPVAPVADVAAVVPAANPGPQPSDQWVEGTAASTQIPGPAVRAYGAAALRIDEEDPACRLGWTTIAAIGAVESGHGTHGGAVLGDDGRPSVPIIGPALDGNGVAAIPATADSTVMHGDSQWDHAVGPLQFLPSSWARWGADGDGDGAADPHDLDDAALAAARYLCAGDRDLSAAEGWGAAVRSYNHSDAYVQDVLRWAETYATVTRD